MNLYRQNHRKVLRRLIDQRGARTMVEVGVSRGHTSWYLLEHCPCLHLTMVDSWQSFEELRPKQFRTRKRRWRSSIEHVEKAKQLAIASTDFARARRTIIQGRSVDVAASLNGEVFDLIFIDASHMRKQVLLDCEAWWPLLAEGGLLCGHDIDHPRPKWGVKEAVEEFCRSHGLEFEVLEYRVWGIK